MHRLIISLFLIFSVVMLSPAMDLTLNGRNISVMDEEALAAFAISLDEDESSLPLNTLFPWLSSVEYLEAQSGPNRVYWESDSFSLETWYEARLIRRAGVWEIHLGRDVFSAPDRIAVQGEVISIETLCIWSALEMPQEKEKLESALAFRDVNLDWQVVSHIEAMLNSPPSTGLPHLVITNHVGRVSFDSILTSWRPLASSPYRWFGEYPEDNGASLPVPMAVDAYHPEAALYFLSLSNAPLFEGDSLSTSVKELLEWATAERANGNLLVSGSPATSVVDMEATVALILPSSSEILSDSMYTVTDDDTGFSVSNYAAIPVGLDESHRAEAELLIDMISSSSDQNSEVNKEPHPMLPRFYEAYERIGRLVISGQMSTAEGVSLMNDYISGQDTND